MGRLRYSVPWGRRLHVEQLEARIAPGSLFDLVVWGQLADGLPAGDVSQVASQAAEQSAGPSGAATQASSLRSRAEVSLAAVLENAADLPRLRRIDIRPWTTSTPGGAATAESRWHPSAELAIAGARAAAFSQLSALGGSQRDSAPLDAILKSITLPTARPATYGGGGGGASTTGGGGGGESPRTILGGPVAASLQDSAGAGQGAPNAGLIASRRDATTGDATTGLVLRDASGAVLDVFIDGTTTLDENTIVVGAATWCGFTVELKSQLSSPEAQAALTGLRLIFAFGNEGGTGPGGVQDAAFLADLPGEAAFLAAASVQPDHFPSAFNSATGKFDLDARSSIVGWWQAKNGITPTASAGFGLVDANGTRLNIVPDANTLIIGAATWCGATKKLVAALETPEIAAQLEGLRIVFAFDHEGGDGPGGVLDAAFLENLPGEVAFLAPGSVRPERLPMAFNAASGQFDLTAVDALNAWASGTLVAGGTCGNKNLKAEEVAPVASTGAAQPQDATGTVATPVQGSGLAQLPLASPRLGQPAAPAPGAGGPGGASGVCVLPGDYSMNGVVDAADYTVWQDTFGAMGVALAADGSGNGEIDTADYQVWVENFGDVCPAVPGAFSITGPTGVQTQKPNTITWEPSAGATSYRFVLSQQSDTSFPLYDEIVTETSWPRDLRSGTYYIGVTAINAAGETLATNAPFQLVVDLPPSDQLLFVTTNKYFVTSTPSYPPLALTFNGVLAADYQCTQVAANAGLLGEPWDGETRHFKAMLTHSAVSLVSRALMEEGVYYNAAGHAIANNRAEVMAGNFAAPILSQNATPLTGVQPVWTGASADGTASNNCINWTTTSGNANAGNLNGTGTNWIFQGTVSCASQQRLYCVGDAPSDWTQVTLDFNDLVAGNDVPAGYGSVPGLTFGSDWLVANDTLGGQLSVAGNYVNFTEPVSALSWQRSLEIAVPGMAAGAAGLAGLTVNVYRDAALVDSAVIPPLDPGQSRTGSSLLLIPAGTGGTVTYEFVRNENPNAPGAPAPLDNLRVLVV